MPFQKSEYKFCTTTFRTTPTHSVLSHHQPPAFIACILNDLEDHGILLITASQRLSTRCVLQLVHNFTTTSLQQVNFTLKKKSMGFVDSLFILLLHQSCNCPLLYSCVYTKFKANVTNSITL